MKFYSAFLFNENTAKVSIATILDKIVVVNFNTVR